MGVNIIQGDILNTDVTTADLIYVDPPFFTQRNFGDYDDRWDSLDSYLKYVLDRLIVGWTHLADSGVFVLHVDPRTSHYFKVSLDTLWGRDKFESEIVWCYNSGGAGKKKLASKHDVLLVYRKGPGTFNILREPYATPNVEGRSGFHPEGRMLTDVWNMSILSTTSKERVGYATQKPLELLRRIIQIYSNPGDTVLDFFAGSGTTGVAALELDRNAVLLDINPDAVRIIEERTANI